MDPITQTQATAEAVAAAKDYADTIIKGPLRELGGILTDTVGHWRLKNQVRLLLRTRDYLKAKGIHPEKVLPQIFVPIMEEGANVADEQLADMFASLLASHLTPDVCSAVHPSFAKVLAQLSPIDARLLRECRRYVSDKQYRDLGLRGSPMQVDRAAELLGISEDEAYLSCLNLRRLGLLRHFGAAVPEGHPVPAVFEDDRDHQEFRITEFGIVFCEVCGCNPHGP